MAKLELRGLNINVKSLKKAVSEMPTTNGALPSLYLQVSYDRADGEVLTDMHADCNSQTRYHDSDIVTIGYYTHRTTAQKLIDTIANTIGLVDQSKQEDEQQAKIMAHNEALWAKENGHAYDEADIIK